MLTRPKLCFNKNRRKYAIYNIEKSYQEWNGSDDCICPFDFFFSYKIFGPVTDVQVKYGYSLVHFTLTLKSVRPIRLEPHYRWSYNKRTYEKTINFFMAFNDKCSLSDFMYYLVSKYLFKQEKKSIIDASYYFGEVYINKDNEPHKSLAKALN